MSARVSDGRRQYWFWLGNEIIDDYAAEMKPMALAVYVYLCRRVDRDGTCWPSQRSMAEDLGIERGTTRTAVKRLVELKLLRVEVRRNDDGSHRSTLYTLLEPVKREAQEGEGGGPLAQGGPYGPEENPEKKVTSEESSNESSSEADGSAEKGEVFGEAEEKPISDMTTPQRQSYYVGYLHRRLKERELLDGPDGKPLTPGYKDRLSGELRLHIEAGMRHGRMLKAIDKIVFRWPEKRLDFYAALDDGDELSRRREGRFSEESRLPKMRELGDTP